MVNTGSHTRVLLFLFRLGFGSVGMSMEAASKTKSSSRSFALGALGVLFACGVSSRTGGAGETIESLKESIASVVVTHW
jgi:hypothetical protein